MRYESFVKGEQQQRARQLAHLNFTERAEGRPVSRPAWLAGSLRGSAARFVPHENPLCERRYERAEPQLVWILTPSRRYLDTWENPGEEKGERERERERQVTAELFSSLSQNVGEGRNSGFHSRIRLVFLINSAASSPRARDNWIDREILEGERERLSSRSLGESTGQSPSAFLGIMHSVIEPTMRIGHALSIICSRRACEMRLGQ